MKRFPTLWRATWVLALFLLLGSQLWAAQQRVQVIQLDGIINSITERYLSRTLQLAQEQGAPLVVITLDTPGGTLSSTRKMVQSILASSVPTVVYVAPAGARAASAGTFITAAANIAAMAPGTNIGAASPVGAGGEDLPKTLASKATNDAAAWMEDIANQRGRNADLLKDTVLKASSFSSGEAVEKNVVDLVASDLPELLEKLDGRRVTLPNGEVVTLATHGLKVESITMNSVERFLFFLADPNVSFLLLTIGGLGIVAEIFNPGLILPGVVGVILLVLAFVVLGSLPFNWAGLALIFLSMLLFVLEVYVSGFGILGAGGVVSLILGGLLLFAQFGPPSPTLPSIRVSLFVLVPTVLTLTGVGALVLLTAVRSRRRGQEPASLRLVGAVGFASSDLDPRGIVQLQDETWTAVAQDDQVIKAGEKVEIVKVEGIILKVRKV